MGFLNQFLWFCAIVNVASAGCCELKKTACDEDYAAAERRFIEVIENRPCMVVDCSDGSVALPISFLEELGTITKLTSDMECDGVWDVLHRNEENRIGAGEKNFLEYIKHGMFFFQTSIKNSQNDLAALLRFHEEKKLPTEDTSLFSMIVFANYFDYTKIDELCKTVLDCIVFGYLNVDVLLKLVPIDESENEVASDFIDGSENEVASDFIDEADNEVASDFIDESENEVASDFIDGSENEVVSDFIDESEKEVIYDFISTCSRKLQRMQPFDIEQECKNYSLTHEFVWQVPDTIFPQIFNARTLSNIVNELKNVDETKKLELLNVFRTVLRIRTFSKPKEYNLYNIILSTEDDLDLNVHFEDQTDPVYACRVNMTRKLSEQYDLQTLLIDKLIINPQSSLSLLFGDKEETTKSINSLNIKFNSFPDKSYNKENKIYKLVPQKKLTLSFISQCMIDFVDTSNVEKVTAIHCESVRFYNNDEIAFFNNAKKVAIKYDYSPNVFLTDDEQHLYPNVEIIELLACYIQDKDFLRKLVVPRKTKFLSMFECNFKEPMTLENIIPDMDSLSISFKSTFFYFYRLKTDFSLFEELKRKYTSMDLDAYTNKIVYVMIFFDLIEEESFSMSSVSNAFIRDSRAPENSVEYFRDVIYMFHAMVFFSNTLLETIGDKIVFIVVMEFDVYLSLKRYSELSSLKYLKVWMGSIPRRIKRLDTDNKHALHTLIVRDMYSEELESLLVSCFDSEALVALEFKYYKSTFIHSPSLNYFTNIKILSINLWIKPEDANYEHTLRDIQKLKNLELLNLRIYETNAKNQDINKFLDSSEDELTLDQNSFDSIYMLLQSIFDECRQLKTVLIMIDKKNKLFCNMKKLSFRSTDGRTYALNTSSYMHKFNLAERSAIRMISRTLYEKIEIGDALYRHYADNESCYKKKMFSWLYELSE